MSLESSVVLSPILALSLVHFDLWYLEGSLILAERQEKEGTKDLGKACELLLT